MKVKTRDFGEIEVDNESILTFSQPPFGFEEYKSYAIIRDEGVGEHIAWLQSVDEPGVCFILFDPSSLSHFYTPLLPKELENELGDGELVCWVIAVVPEDFKRTTVNLKSPVILNLNTCKGTQLILEQEYPVRYYLMQEAK